MLTANITSVIACRLGPHAKGKYTKAVFEYYESADTYTCPNRSSIRYKTTTHEGYKEYSCTKETCDNCLKEISVSAKK